MGSNSISMVVCIIAILLVGFGILLELINIRGIEYSEILFISLPIILIAIGVLGMIFSKD